MDTTSNKKATTTTGARALIDVLVREGIDHVFGIPGTQNLAILDALRDTPSIRFILTRHEQGAAFMAYGFARASGKPSVVTATEGPGVTNLATGIGAANRAYLPVISICGVQESEIRERDATQDLDQVTFMRPLTKWAYSIPNARKVQESVRKAFRVALTEPYGPTHIEASSEILLEPVQPETTDPAAYRAPSGPRVRKRCSIGCSRFWRMRSARCSWSVAACSTKTPPPRWLRSPKRSAYRSPPCSIRRTLFHPPTALALGPLGRNGWESANTAVPQADAIIAIGAHMDVYLDDVQARHLQQGCEARASHIRRRSHRHRLSGRCRNRRVDGEHDCRAERARRAGGIAQGVDRCRQGPRQARQRAGRRSSNPTRTRSSRSSSPT